MISEAVVFDRKRIIPLLATTVTEGARCDMRHCELRI